MESNAKKEPRLEEQKYLTVAEAATYARTRKHVVYGWIRQGLVNAFAPPGTKRLVRRTEIDGLVKSHRVTDETPNPHRDVALARKGVVAC